MITIANIVANLFILGLALMFIGVGIIIITGIVGALFKECRRTAK